jgi:hypothetical protein
MENINYETLGQALSRSNGNAVFKNDKGEYCRVSRYYIKNTEHFQVIFSKSVYDTATRFAINSISEKKILKFLNSEKFVRCDINGILVENS